MLNEEKITHSKKEWYAINTKNKSINERINSNFSTINESGRLINRYVIYSAKLIQDMLQVFRGIRNFKRTDFLC